MNSYICQPIEHPPDATVTLPGSKSITNRALIAAALAEGTSVISNVLLAEDTQLMIAALHSLGIAVSVDQPGHTVEITGCRGHLPAGEAELYCGNAGTVMRFCAAMVSLGYGRFELDGSDRMRQRPIGPLVEVLQRLGAGVEFLGQEGFPPLAIHAKGLHGGRVSFGQVESSQFVSALLMSAPLASGDVLIEVPGPVPSKPYLEMTTAIMGDFGAAVLSEFGEADARFVVAAPQRYLSRPYRVEPDASNATYFLAIPAIAGGRITVSYIGTNSVQGDAAFVDVLEQMGCRIDRHATELTVQGPPPGDRLQGVDVDLNDMPDTAQTLAVIALFAEGPTVIRNVGNLRVKETDRISALAQELTKLGATVEQRPDGLTITPPARIKAATIETYDDHRMAMSFALAGLKVPGLTIKNPQCCGKTFPDFFDRWEATIHTPA